MMHVFQSSLANLCAGFPKAFDERWTIPVTLDISLPVDSRQDILLTFAQMAGVESRPGPHVCTCC
jgi:hypothetical protein